MNTKMLTILMLGLSLSSLCFGKISITNGVGSDSLIKVEYREMSASADEASLSQPWIQLPASMSFSDVNKKVQFRCGSTILTLAEKDSSSFGVHIKGGVAIWSFAQLTAVAAAAAPTTPAAGVPTSLSGAAAMAKDFYSSYINKNKK